MCPKCTTLEQVPEDRLQEDMITSHAARTKTFSCSKCKEEPEQLLVQVVAVKLFLPEPALASWKKQVEIFREAYLLHSVHYKSMHVMPFYGMCLAPTKTHPLCIVTKFFTGGNLEAFTRKESTNLEFEDIVHIAGQAAAGLNFLHSQQPAIIRTRFPITHLFCHDDCIITKLRRFVLYNTACA